MSNKPTGILKRTAREPGAHSSTSSLKWDEEALAAYDTQRGKTQKITEPKTPYILYNHSTDTVEGSSAFGGGIPALELNVALKEAEVEDVVDTSVVDWDSDEEGDGDGDEDDDDDGRRSDRQGFDAARHQHYDMKNALARGKELVDEEEADCDVDHTDEMT